MKTIEQICEVNLPVVLLLPKSDANILIQALNFLNNKKSYLSLSTYYIIFHYPSLIQSVLMPYERMHAK